MNSIEDLEQLYYSNIFSASSQFDYGFSFAISTIKVNMGIRSKKKLNACFLA